MARIPPRRCLSRDTDQTRKLRVEWHGSELAAACLHGANEWSSIAEASSCMLPITQARSRPRLMKGPPLPSSPLYATSGDILRL